MDTIAASYFDGRSSRRHAVTLELAGDHLTLHGLDAPATYAFHQTRLAEPFAGAPCVIDLDDGARLEVERAAYPLLMRALRRRHSLVERCQRHWQGAIASVVLMVAALLGMVKWGVPLAAETLVAAMPLSVDQAVGDKAEEVLEGHLFHPSKLSAQRIATVEAIFDQVRPADARPPLTVKLMRMDGDVANAIALPNGTIIMSDAMVQHVFEEGNASVAERRAQLAGVLAHEIGHVRGRHGMRSLTRGSLVAAGSAALFGDFSALAAGLPALLLNMDYSRDMERAADEYAIGRLRELGIPCAPLADLIESIDKENREGMERDRPGVEDYFSSHPATSERGKRLRTAGLCP